MLKNIDQMIDDGKIAYKNKSIPIVRIDIRESRDTLNAEQLPVIDLPKVYLYVNGEYYEYEDAFNVNFFLYFANRHLYPVVILKSIQDVELFSNTDIEWVENTPFWRGEYLSIQNYFNNFIKVTRVIAFVENKKEYKDELKQFESAALNSASRNDLRIAKVTDKEIIKHFKQKMGHQWFGALSNNTIVLFKKKYEADDEEVAIYDLSYDSLPIFDFLMTKI